MGYALEGVPWHELPPGEQLYWIIDAAKQRDNCMTYEERYAAETAKYEIRAEKAKVQPNHKKTADLKPGDECQFKKETDIVRNVSVDDDGIWVDWETGDCGYVSESTMFNVIAEWNW